MGVTGGILVGNLVKVVNGEENTAMVDTDGTTQALDLSKDDTRVYKLPVVAAVMETRELSLVSTRVQDSDNKLAPPDKHVIGTSIILSNEKWHIQQYSVKAYTDLNHLLGNGWHFRGLNANGDYS